MRINRMDPELGVLLHSAPDFSFGISSWTDAQPLMSAIDEPIPVFCCDWTCRPLDIFKSIIITPIPRRRKHISRVLLGVPNQLRTGGHLFLYVKQWNWDEVSSPSCWLPAGQPFSTAQSFTQHSRMARRWCDGIRGQLTTPDRKKGVQRSNWLPHVLFYGRVPNISKHM